jgi:hypothetical protein
MMSLDTFDRDWQGIFSGKIKGIEFLKRFVRLPYAEAIEYYGIR